MSKKSRTLVERAKAIFLHLERYADAHSEESLPKSSFQEIGISTKDIDQWLELIVFIQNKPRIAIDKKGRNTSVNLMENKFMTYLKSKLHDKDMGYDERSSVMLTYLKVLISVEKSKGTVIDWSELIEDPLEISKPTIIKLIEEGKEIMENQ